MMGRSVGQKKKKGMNPLRVLGSFKKRGDAEPKDFVSVDVAENVGTIVMPFGHHKILTRSCACKLKYLLL